MNLSPASIAAAHRAARSAERVQAADLASLLDAAEAGWRCDAAEARIAAALRGPGMSDAARESTRARMLMAHTAANRPIGASSTARDLNRLHQGTVHLADGRTAQVVHIEPITPEVASQLAEQINAIAPVKHSR